MSPLPASKRRVAHPHQEQAIWQEKRHSGGSNRTKRRGRQRRRLIIVRIEHISLDVIIDTNIIVMKGARAERGRAGRNFVLSPVAASVCRSDHQTDPWRNKSKRALNPPADA
jgi:hypothetical protein